MKMTSEERELLKRMDAGELDGIVGDMFQNRWRFNCLDDN